MVEKGKHLDKGHPPRLGDFEPELKTSASLDQMAPKESGRWKSSLCSGFAVLERSLARKLWEPLCTDCKAKHTSRLWVLFFPIFFIVIKYT